MVTSKDAIMHLINQAVSKAGKGAEMLGKGTATGLGMAEKGLGATAPKAQAMLQKLRMKADASPKTTGAIVAGAGAAGGLASMMGKKEEDDEGIDEEYLELLDKIEEKQRMMSQRRSLGL